MKRTPLRKVSKKQKVKHLENTRTKGKMRSFFLRIWEERSHYSEVSGEYLGNFPLSWMFDHLLEKSKYPDFAFEKNNIALVTFEEHEAKTNGRPLPKHQELIDNAKKLFNV
jgi:hypothetical protein